MWFANIFSQLVAVLSTFLNATFQGAQDNSDDAECADSLDSAKYLFQ
jgi:hypothetical protein